MQNLIYCALPLSWIFLNLYVLELIILLLKKLLWILIHWLLIVFPRHYCYMSKSLRNESKSSESPVAAFVVTFAVTPSGEFSAVRAKTKQVL